MLHQCGYMNVEVANGTRQKQTRGTQTHCLHDICIVHLEVVVNVSSYLLGSNLMLRVQITIITASHVIEKL